MVTEEAQQVIYELRIYAIAYGKMAEQHRRFSESTLGFFKKHGFGSASDPEVQAAILNSDGRHRRDD